MIMPSVYWYGRLNTSVDALLGSITQNITTGIPGTYENLNTTTDGDGNGAVLTIVLSTMGQQINVSSVTVTSSGKRYKPGDNLIISSIPSTDNPIVFTLGASVNTSDIIEPLPPPPELWTTSVGIDGQLKFNAWSGYYETTPDIHGELIPDVSKPVRELIASFSSPNMTQDIKNAYI